MRHRNSPPHKLINQLGEHTTNNIFCVISPGRALSPRERARERAISTRYLPRVTHHRRSFSFSLLLEDFHKCSISTPAQLVSICHHADTQLQKVFWDENRHAPVCPTCSRKCRTEGYIGPCIDPLLHHRLYIVHRYYLPTRPISQSLPSLEHFV